MHAFHRVREALLALQQQQPVELLHILLRWLNEHPDQAGQRFHALLRLLRRHEALRRDVAALFCQWLLRVRLYPLWVSLGILPRQGFRRELSQRIYERINPAHRDFQDLRDVFLHLFGREEAIEFLPYLSLRDAIQMVQTLQEALSPELQRQFADYFREEGLYAIEMLSIWIAAEELEPEFIRLDKKLLDADSPLVALHREINAWLPAQRQGEDGDERHMEVMLIQCHEQLERLRKYAITAGSSLEVAHSLERLQQTLQRLQQLLYLFQRKRFRRTPFIHFFMLLIQQTPAQCEIIPLWRRNIKMLARSISQNKSNHGEHYITQNAREYWQMFASAALAGCVIAFMALIKIVLGASVETPLLRHLLEGLNYGLGFMLIHVLGGTVATKQPAMTAASFAQAVERNEKGGSMRQKLAALLIDVFRSQSIAVFGNVLLAILVAMFLARSFAQSQGSALLDAAAVEYHRRALHPLSLTLWYAAIAGLWLFCSGMISGFYDNRCQYLNLRLRLRFHPLLKRFLSPRRREQLADYVHEHYGSLMGNFAFGMLLGMTAYLGYISGLPLDIRHVAFSSANLGYASVSADFSAGLFLQTLFFVLLIGLVNLWISFWIALSVALRARDSRIESWWAIFRDVGACLKKEPRLLFLPPKKSASQKED